MQISHITFIVHDIERTTVMLQQLFDAKVIYDSGKNTFSLSQERFFDIDGLWLVIMQGESLKETTYNHIAFKIDEKEYPFEIKENGEIIKAQMTNTPIPAPKTGVDTNTWLYGIVLGSAILVTTGLVITYNIVKRRKKRNEAE